MSDSITENEPIPEQENQAETVELNQEFILFAPRRTNSEPSHNIPEITRFFSSVSLRTGLLPDLPINIDTFAQKTNRVYAIVPFSPRLGYRINQADFDINRRIQKIRRWRGYNPYGGRQIDSKKAPLFIVVSQDDIGLVDIGLGKQIGLSVIVDERVSTLASRLRLHLLFPDQTFESKSSDPIGIRFVKFYPADLGPLASLPFTEVLDRGLTSVIEGTELQEGLELFVPSNPKILGQIRGRFVLAEDESQSVPIPSMG